MDTPSNPFDRMRAAGASARRAELESSIVDRDSEADSGRDARGESEQLVIRAQGGDQTAIGEIYERYYDRLHRYARVRLKANRGADAGDIVNDAFVRLQNGGLGRFEYRGKDSLYAYLQVIARNLVKYEQALGDNRPGVGGETAEFEFLRRQGGEQSPSMLRRASELEEILEDAMAQLPPLKREVLQLRQHLEMPSREVAIALGLADEHAVNRLYYEARKQWLELARPRLKPWLEQTG